MRKVAILTTDNLEGFFVYDNMLSEPFKAKGWHATEVSWRAPNIDWNDYEVVIIRSTWDYQSDHQAFLDCLDTIESSQASLENSLDLVKWNVSKEYLKSLEDKGIPIVPTLWAAQFNEEQLVSSFDHFNSKEIVIKPLVSANADSTYRLSKTQLLAQKSVLENEFSDRKFMIQPFINSVVSEGEYSLFYFLGQFSHCILKVPKATDFRVQEEHGGQLQSVQPSEVLLQVSSAVLAALPEMPLYARVDLIRTDNGFALMEIELIEPSLYFNMDSKSAHRFVDAFCQKYG